MDDELLRELGAAAESVGCSVLHTELVGNTLRVVLDHSEGVTIEHCASVARQVSVVLDAADYGKSRYLLEVTSPGLDRRLYSKEDYARFAGRLVRMTYKTADGSKRTITGHLEVFDPEQDDSVVLVEPVSDEAIEVPYGRIERTRLEIDI